MQMAAAYSSIANGGLLRPPHVVKSINGRKLPVPAGKRVISRQTALAVSRMLEGVLDPDGTASMAAIEGYKLAGKTGTAQKAEAGGYSATKYVASFVGFAPARNPRLLVTVMVDEPQGDIYGGVVAAPAFRKITSFALNYLQIPPQ
jgi:cell division protein FtsI (penicillin-binding protein 3)